jgi:hypothetical protein
MTPMSIRKRGDSNDNRSDPNDMGVATLERPSRGSSDEQRFVAAPGGQPKRVRHLMGIDGNFIYTWQVHGQVSAPGQPQYSPASEEGAVEQAEMGNKESRKCQQGGPR